MIREQSVSPPWIKWAMIQGGPTMELIGGSVLPSTEPPRLQDKESDKSNAQEWERGPLGYRGKVFQGIAGDLVAQGDARVEVEWPVDSAP